MPPQQGPDGLRSTAVPASRQAAALAPLRPQRPTAPPRALTLLAQARAVLAVLAGVGQHDGVGDLGRAEGRPAGGRRRAWRTQQLACLGISGTSSWRGRRASARQPAALPPASSGGSPSLCCSPLQLRARTSISRAPSRCCQRCPKGRQMVALNSGSRAGTPACTAGQARGGGGSGSTRQQHSCWPTGMLLPQAAGESPGRAGCLPLHPQPARQPACTPTQPSPAQPSAPVM